jgi:hypothetical protein
MLSIVTGAIGGVSPFWKWGTVQPVSAGCVEYTPVEGEGQVRRMCRGEEERQKAKGEGKSGASVSPCSENKDTD